MATSSQVYRESQQLVPSTCPIVDKALEDAKNTIKEQTDALRDALNEAIRRYLDAEDRIDELEKEISELRLEIDELQEEESWS